jgi:hypothetical protein
MSTINTLTEFLTQADTQFQLFDMGRQVRPLASDTFVRIEQQQEPYPWPLQQHAWLGVHFFQPAESRHYSSSLRSMSAVCSSAAAPSSSWIRWSRPWATS